MAERDGGLFARTPPSPPIVEMAGGEVSHLLCWEQHERDGSWHAWISWVQVTGAPGRHRHHVVSVRADAVQQVESPEAYKNVPRRVLGRDGQIRPWTSRPPDRAARDRPYHLNELGDSVVQAIAAGKSLVQDAERVLGPDHPDTLTSRNNLANAYRDAGRAAEAIELHERTLADRERVLGPDHLDTLGSRNNLALAYEAANSLHRHRWWSLRRRSPLS